MGQEDPTCTSDLTRVGESRLHGRGVFAAKPLRAGQIVMEVAVLVLKQSEAANAPSIEGYCYEWPLGGNGRALALGEASFLNHGPSRRNESNNGTAAKANLTWETDEQQGRIRFRASRDIQPGEELLIDYGDGYRWREPPRE